MPFVKLDCEILESSLWSDRDLRDAFITALLLARPFELEEPTPQISVRSLDPTGWTVPPGRYGFVAAAGVGIVSRAGLDRETGLQALEALGSPDPESRSQDHEGRRLVRVDGGYLVLNFDRFRAKDHTSAKRSKSYRDRKRHAVTAVTDRDASRKSEDRGHTDPPKSPPPEPPAVVPDPSPGLRPDPSVGESFELVSQDAQAPRQQLGAQFAHQVLDLLRAAVRDVTRGRDRGPMNTEHNRKLILDWTRKAGATLEEWTRAIEYQAESVRPDPSAWRYLEISFFCRPKNWGRCLNAPRSGGRRLAAWAPSEFDQRTQPEDLPDATNNAHDDPW